MSRQALVTGATGFIGSHLVERLLAGGWNVCALARPASDTTLLHQLGVRLIRGDLADPRALERGVQNVEVVFHLAAVTAARSAGDYHAANVEGTRALVRAIGHSSSPRRLVLLSSYAACGPSNGRPRRFDDPACPLSPYGRTKLESERVACEIERNGVGVVVVRAPAVYGPRDRALLTYFRLVNWRLAPVPAGTDRRLHLLFAPDLARALVRAADVGPGTYVVADPIERTWSDVIEILARTLGRRPLRLPLPAPLVRSAAALTEKIGALGGRRVAFNREKAEEMLAAGWTCELTEADALLPAAEATPLAEGLARTAAWYASAGWL